MQAKVVRFAIAVFVWFAALPAAAATFSGKYAVRFGFDLDGGTAIQSGFIAPATTTSTGAGGGSVVVAGAVAPGPILDTTDAAGNIVLSLTLFEVDFFGTTGAPGAAGSFDFDVEGSFGIEFTPPANSIFRPKIDFQFLYDTSVSNLALGDEASLIYTIDGTVFFTGQVPLGSSGSSSVTTLGGGSTSLLDLYIVEIRLQGSIRSPGTKVPPIPLPAAAPLLLGGLAVLGLVARRRRG